MTGTWEDGILAAARPLLEGVAHVYPEPLDFIDARLDDLREREDRAAAVGAEAEAYFLMIADCALQLYQPEGVGRAEALAMIIHQVIGKQADYGPSNILWGGIPGIVLRMHDKTARCRNLLSRYWAAKTPGEETAANEPLSDSYLDLVGYSLVALMVLQSTFGNPLERDLPIVPEKWDGNLGAILGQFNQQAVAAPPPHAPVPPALETLLGSLRDIDGEDAYALSDGGRIEVQHGTDGTVARIYNDDGEWIDIFGCITKPTVHFETSEDSHGFSMSSDTLQVFLSMLIGVAESVYGWQNTNIHAEVPKHD